MILDLYRMAEGPDYTLGRLEDEEHRPVCMTAERAWVDLNGDGLGDRGLSRVPAGVYRCHRDLHNKTSPNAYEVWELENVPGRSEIHVHRGNRPVTESKGCILVGTTWGGNGTVANSGVAFARLMKLTAGLGAITLRIHDVPPRAA